MEIIDAHAHIYPEKIAEKATNAIGDFYGIKMNNEKGTTDKLIENGKEIGVSKFIVHSCATKALQVHSINEFIKSEMTAHKEFIGFMTLHQDMTEEEIYYEIKWCIDAGFKGIKLHPDFQKFNIDDESVDKIYNTVEKFDKVFPILFHTGDDRYEYSRPYRLANVCKKHKKLYAIAAHFGGYRCWNQTDVYKGLDNVFFDTSSSLSFITTELAKEKINTFGAEKFFFGSDFPMWKAKDELELFNKIPLSDREKELILA